MSEQPALAHHFDDLAQQHEAAGLGMWAFLATEVLFFGGLFVGYGVYRAAYPHAFAEGSHHLYTSIAAVNTGVLLTSSFAMAMAVHAAHTARRRALIGWLWLTAGLGFGFLVLKGVEYYLDWHDRLVPGVNFHLSEVPAGVLAEHVELFVVLYFVMTGIHALHVTIGVGLLTVLAVRAHLGRFAGNRSNIVEMTGLYWHFVDVIWIFLFPLLYLVA